MLKIDENTLKMMNQLALSYAFERVKEHTDTFQSLFQDAQVSQAPPEDMREKVRKLIGQLLATSYAKGYADCYESKKIKRLFL